MHVIDAPNLIEARRMLMELTYNRSHNATEVQSIKDLYIKGESEHGAIMASSIMKTGDVVTITHG
jgi:hypothetical protein